MAKTRGARAASKSVKAASGIGASDRAKNRVFKDVSIIFFAGLIVSLLLQKAALYYDWDTIDSIIRMNAVGYNPISVPPVKYHLLIEPTVFLISSILSPAFGPDRLVGFIVMVAVFSASLLALTYYTVFKITSDRVAALVATAMLGISYNFVYLTLTATQNQVNQFFNLLAILIALAILGRVSMSVDRRLLAVALGGTIGLAVGTNLRSLYLLVLLPLIWLLGDDKKSVLKHTLIAGICALAAIIALASTSYALGQYTGLTGFFTVGYLQDSNFWFFAGHGDLGTQATTASVGFLRSFLGDDIVGSLGIAYPALSVGLAIVVFGLFAYLLRLSLRDPAVIVIGILMTILSVYSFFYEPVSLERWDHAALFLALLAGVAWAGRVNGTQKASTINKLIISLVLAIMAMTLLMAIGNVTQSNQYITFAYAKAPAMSFAEHSGLLLTTAPKDSVPAMYMVYLYGKENVIFSSSFKTNQEMQDFVRKSRDDQTVYVDTNEVQALDTVDGSAVLLQAAVPVDDSGYWYRLDKV